VTETNIDYVISAVRHSRGQKRIIDSVKQHRLYGNSVGQGEEASREKVISNIDGGMIYYTAVFSSGRFTLGDKVIKYSLPSGDYIRTDGNRIEGDNLGSLPPF
jgi:hypothetical protein